MPLESNQYNLPKLENYDESEVKSLTEQGWQVDADGLNEEEALQMTQNMTVEYKLFRKEDGTCMILVKQQSAYENLSGGNTDIGGIRSDVNNSVNDVMGEYTSSTGTNGRP
jgi:hypothetical protein